MNNTDTTNNTKIQPVTDFCLGIIKAEIWETQTETGNQYHVTFSRFFRDGESPKNPHTYSRDEVILLSKVADKAHSWIHDHEKQVVSIRRLHAEFPKCPREEWWP